MTVSLAVLIAVFLLITIRKIGHLHIKIWQAMSGGALVVLVTGEIGWFDALMAIDFNVMLFLLSMFVIGQALVDSGYLYFLAYKLFGRLTSARQLVLGILFGAALTSALLMNDTIAIVGTPLVLRLAREHKINSQLLLLTLAYAITIGSVMSPIGNPQNLLIASVGGLSSPFSSFFKALALPTFVNLGLTYLVLHWVYRSQFVDVMPLVHTPVKVLDLHLTKLARISLFLVVSLITLNVALSYSHSEMQLKLAYIAIIAALPVLLFSPKRLQVLKELDWSTLLFFASMFVVMSSVWRSGIMQQLLNHNSWDLTNVPVIMIASSALSQLISNVPLVALYLPLLGGQCEPETLMALAAGSTIAGNFLILGAASNVIVIQHAEKHGATLGFFEFARVGVPLGLINLFVYWLWFRYGIT